VQVNTQNQVMSIYIYHETQQIRKQYSQDQYSTYYIIFEYPVYLA